MSGPGKSGPREFTVFRSGEWIAQSQASIALNDLGFVQGATITDLVRTFQGTPYLALEHARRFLGTGKQSGILPESQLSWGPLDETALVAIIETIVARNLPLVPAGTELAIVLLATPGIAEHYLPRGSSLAFSGPTVIVHCFPIQKERYASWFQQGAALRLVDARQVPVDCYPSRWKTRSRLQWWLADRQARQKEPGALALLQNQKGEILETALAHLILVSQGTLWSPPSKEVLQGISLTKLKSLAEQAGLNWQERAILPKDLFEADEVLLTGTMFCLAGVSRFEGRERRWPGPTLTRLQELWWSEIGQNLSHWFVKNP